MFFVKSDILWLLCCFKYLTASELNLSDGSACITEGINGTCVSVFRCMSAAHTYIYLNAGISEEKVPPLPDICTYTDGIPVVCCTDCIIHEHEAFKDSVLSYLAVLKKKEGPKALNKCMDYSQYLPYACRGYQNVRVRKYWIAELRCHGVIISGALAMGGRGAERWEYPHMALLGYGDTMEQAEWHCGGTVISEWFILTAAHCVYSDLLRSQVSYAALGLLKRSDPLEYWKIYNIKEAIRHPMYKAPSKYHDIALLRTETEINFSRYLLPACLDNVKTNARYKVYAAASGWGELGHHNPLADTLQVIGIQEYNETECKSHYPGHRLMRQGYNHTTQMCYGRHDKIVDTCRGDSGGPLQVNLDDFGCQYTVIGVTSVGIRGCGILGVPTIYTRVSYYLPWIESIVWPGED